MKLKLLTTLIITIMCLVFQANAQNLLTNGGYENGNTGWNNLVGGGGIATYSISTTDKYEGNQAMKVAVSKAATNAWDIQSLGSSLSLSLNKKYIVSLYAKSETNGAKLNIVLQNSGYWSKSITLTTIWTKYEFEYIASETAPVFKLQFPSTGNIFIDDINVSIYVPAIANTLDKISINPSIQFQKMVGFGGALTWFCPRIVKSSKKAEIYNLLFNDLGADIIRFKNWYYPANYPTDKSINNIEGGIYWKEHLTATTELANLAKQTNPNVQTLLCSWTPPSYLKSNNKQEQGTLKKSNNNFMYNEFATYWDDLLNNVGFNPDYISIQNEPGFITPDWGTCEWRPTETVDYPGYDKALDAVYAKIQSRPNMPKMIGPETENIGSSNWNSSLNLFREFTSPLKNKSYLHAYAFHPYNYYNSPYNLDKSYLNIIKNEFNDKPNFMTEFSSGNFKWLHTADAIITMLKEANVSAYIYWTMMWAPSSDAMIEVDDKGDYTVGKQYYAIKHFSKYVDKDYKRIEIANINENIKQTGFINPDNNQITLIILNKGENDITSSINLADYKILNSKIYQSDSVNNFLSKGQLSVNGEVILPDSSITTIVLDVQSIKCSQTATITASGATTFCNGGSVNLTSSTGTSYIWKNGTTTVATTASYLAKTSGNYSVIVTNASGCKDTSTATVVTVNALPTATITASGATTFCNGGSVNLTSSTGSSYVWRNGVTTVGTSASYTAKTAGSYSVIVTNASGCKDTSAATVVTVNALPTATITASGATSFCNGGSVNLTSSTGSSYVWRNGTTTVGTTSSYLAKTAGSYTVIVTNASGCKDTSTATTVTVNALPTATITASGATTFCNGGSVNLTSSTGSSYVWRNGTTTVGTTASYLAKTAGSYTVIVTNASGCKDTSAATVVTVNALPTATITASGATTFCNGGSVNLSSSTGTSYVWRNGTTIVGTSSSYLAKTAGNYTVIVTNASGCKDTSAATVVTVNTLPTATITASGATTFCNGGSVNLTSSTGASYVWRNGTTTVATTASYTAKTAGNYTVIVTNASGCKDTSAATVVTVNETLNPSIITGDDIVCANSTSRTYSITNIAEASAYTWTVPTGASITSGTNTNSIVVSFASTSGNVSVSATNGCGVGSVVKKAISIVTNCITFDALPTKTSIDLTWDIEGINVKTIQIMRNTSASTSGRIRLTSVGYSPQNYSDTSALDNTDYWYWLKITDVNNVVYNSNSVQGKIAVVTGVKPLTSNETSVYPNPYEHDFQIKKQGVFHYSIEDLHGKTLLKGDAENETFTGNSLPTGVYMLKITANNNTEVVKVVKR